MPPYIYREGTSRPSFYSRDYYDIYRFRDGAWRRQSDRITDEVLWNESLGRWEYRIPANPFLPNVAELEEIEAWHSSPVVTPIVNCRLDIEDEYEQLVERISPYYDGYRINHSPVCHDNIIANLGIAKSIYGYGVGTYFFHTLVSVLDRSPDLLDGKYIFINSLEVKNQLLDEKEIEKALEIRKDVSRQLGVCKNNVFVINGLYTTVMASPGNAEQGWTKANRFAMAVLPGVISIAIRPGYSHFDAVATFRDEILFMLNQMNELEFPADEETIVDVCNDIEKEILAGIDQDIKVQEQILHESRLAVKVNLQKRNSSMSRKKDAKAKKISKEIFDDVRLLRKFKDIKSVNVYSNSKVSIHTNNLTISTQIRPDLFEGKSVEIGEYRFELWLGRMNSSYIPELRIYNASGPRNGWQHPHIGESGKPCFAEWEHSLVEAADSASLFNIVSIILNYLKTFNPEDSYGRNIESFDPDNIFGFNNDGNPFRVEREDGEYNDEGDWIQYEDGENCEYRGGEWVLYRDGVNGTWRRVGWVWYEEGSNGEFKDDGDIFVFWDDGDNGEFVNGRWQYYNEDGVLENTNEEEEVNA